MEYAVDSDPRTQKFWLLSRAPAPKKESLLHCILGLDMDITFHPFEKMVVCPFHTKFSACLLSA